MRDKSESEFTVSHFILVSNRHDMENTFFKSVPSKQDIVLIFYYYAVI